MNEQFILTIPKALQPQIEKDARDNDCTPKEWLERVIMDVPRYEASEDFYADYITLFFNLEKGKAPHSRVMTVCKNLNISKSHALHKLIFK